jgi:hypothetical protein
MWGKIEGGCIMANNSKQVSCSSAYSALKKTIDDQQKDFMNMINNIYNHIIGVENTERACFKIILRNRAAI